MFLIFNIGVSMMFGSFMGDLICGNVSYEDKNFSEIKVMGNADLTKVTVNRLTQVNGKTDISGFLRSNSSRFFDNILITTKRIELIDTKITSLTVKKTDEIAQEVFLSGATVVSGSITFEKGDGTVFVKDGARIDGEVIGGRIINQ